jgi:hypothetical protein
MKIIISTPPGSRDVSQWHKHGPPEGTVWVRVDRDDDSPDPSRWLDVAVWKDGDWHRIARERISELMEWYSDHGVEFSVVKTPGDYGPAVEPLEQNGQLVPESEGVPMDVLDTEEVTPDGSRAVKDKPPE